VVGNVIITSLPVTVRTAKYCDQPVSMSVCLPVRSRFSKTTCPNFASFLYGLPVAVARSSLNDNAISYVHFRFSGWRHAVTEWGVYSENHRDHM